jgi:FXSXX-COOH protein
MDISPVITARPVVLGLTDTRSTPLGQLAGGVLGIARDVRRVLPAVEPGRVSVAAFNSSL